MLVRRKRNKQNSKSEKLTGLLVLPVGLLVSWWTGLFLPAGLRAGLLPIWAACPLEPPGSAAPPHLGRLRRPGPLVSWAACRWPSRASAPRPLVPCGRRRRGHTPPLAGAARARPFASLCAPPLPLSSLRHELLSRMIESF